MTVKPIIDIDINDDAFKRFAELYAKHDAALKKAPDTWKVLFASIATGSAAVVEGIEATTESVEHLTKSVEATTSSFGSTLAAIKRQGDEIEKIKRGTDATTRSAKEQAHSWRQMAHDAGEFAGKIGEATRSLLRWGTITGVISGILGGGGLFGIDRLAINAGNQRRESLGLGTTPGEKTAFDTNFGRVIDTDKFLSGVNEALHDVTKRVSLRTTGLTETDLAGKDTAQVASELLPAIKKLLDKTPDAELAQVLKAYKLDQVLTPQDAQRLKATPASELAGYQAQADIDRKNLELSKEQQKAWQDLQVQFTRAGVTIENTFIKGLTPLAPAIEKLSQAFTQAVADILSSPQLKVWIEDLGAGIKWLADYISSGDFKDAFVKTAKTIGEFATGVANIVSGFSDAVTHIKSWFSGDVHLDQETLDNGANGPLKDDNVFAPGSPAFNEYRRLHPGQLPPRSGGEGEGGLVHKSAYYRFLGGGFGDGSQRGFDTSGPDAVTPAVLASVEYQESRGQDVTNQKSGAAGYLQFMPDTARQYGVNVHDEQSSLQGANRYLNDLKTQFGGSLEKALAAYNFGPGNLQKDITTYGDNWRSHLPDETKKYVSDILGRLGQQQNQVAKVQDKTVVIRIDNNTGGNASVSASQLVT